MLPRYMPVDCHWHDELELLCMRGAERAVRYRDGATERTVTGRCSDLIATGGEEFLAVDGADGRHLIRLDLVCELAVCP